MKLIMSSVEGIDGAFFCRPEYRIGQIYLKKRPLFTARHSTAEECTRDGLFPETGLRARYQVHWGISDNQG